MDSITFAATPTVARTQRLNTKHSQRPTTWAKPSARRVDRQADCLTPSIRSLEAKSAVHSRGVAARATDIQCGWFDRKDESPAGGKQKIVVIGNGMVGLKFLQHMTELDVNGQFEVSITNRCLES